MGFGLLTQMVLGTAWAGTWSKQPIEPKARPTNTAYTIGKNHWQLGLVRQNYGLLDNLQVGTVAPLWFVGVFNGNGKVTAIQTRRFDVSLDGGLYYTSLKRFGVDGRVFATPVGWTASWAISDRFSVHGGTGWTSASIDGRVSADDIAQALVTVIGADVSPDLLASVPDSSGLFAGANLSLFQTRLSADFRLNRRDSIILTSNTYVYLSGLLAAGVDVDPAQGAEVQAGASARIRVPLGKSIPSLTTLSWQFDWRRVNLRVGVPIPFNNAFAYFQAFDLYVILGESRNRQARSEED